LENPQFPPNELAFLFEKILFKIKRKKISAFLVYTFIVAYFSLPGLNVPLLEFNRFRITSLMEQRALENGLQFYPRQSWVNIDEVNPALLKAIISMEDGSFFTHKGIDWKELRTSLQLNLRRGRTARGGSTITMQTAKNLFLSTNRSFFRKGKEFIISFRMEKEISKKAILQNYINAVEWGEGIFGIAKASDIYFNKTPKELTINESARLAAVIPSPLKYQPNSNAAYVTRRASIIRGRLNDVVLYPKVKL
jgi:monofunctional glycosyltransferase